MNNESSFLLPEVENSSLSHNKWRKTCVPCFVILIIILIPFGMNYMYHDNTIQDDINLNENILLNYQSKTLFHLPTIPITDDNTYILDVNVNKVSIPIPDRFLKHIENPRYLTFNSRLYNGKFSGGLIVAIAGSTLRINLINNLHPSIPSSSSSSSSTAGEIIDEKDVWNTFREPNITNLHVHGLHVSPMAPADDVYGQVAPSSNNNRNNSNNSNEHIYEYSIPANHPEGLYFYHPHHHGSATLQQGGGMAGPILILRPTTTPSTTTSSSTISNGGSDIGGDITELESIGLLPLLSSDSIAVVNTINFCCGGGNALDVSHKAHSTMSIDPHVVFDNTSSEGGIDHNNSDDYMSEIRILSQQWSVVNDKISPLAVLEEGASNGVHRLRFINANINNVLLLKSKLKLNFNSKIHTDNADAIVDNRNMSRISSIPDYSGNDHEYTYDTSKYCDMFVTAADGITLRSPRFTMMTDNDPVLIVPGSRRDIVFQCNIDKLNEEKDDISNKISEEEINKGVDAAWSISIISSTPNKDTSPSAYDALGDGASVSEAVNPPLLSIQLQMSTTTTTTTTATTTTTTTTSDALQSDSPSKTPLYYQLKDADWSSVIASQLDSELELERNHGSSKENEQGKEKDDVKVNKFSFIFAEGSKVPRGDTNYTSYTVNSHSMPSVGSSKSLLKGQSMIYYDKIHDVREVKLDSIEEWVVSNSYNSAAHPFHLHVNHFQILNIQSMLLKNESNIFSSLSSKSGSSTNYKAPDFSVGDWRDSITIPPLTNITIRWRAKDYVGLSMAHCHITTHSDTGMGMAFRIIP